MQSLGLIVVYSVLNACGTSEFLILGSFAGSGLVIYAWELMPLAASAYWVDFIAL